jgi:hypothetical protein
MAISVRSLMDDHNDAVSEQAVLQFLSADGETPYRPFSLRELITPQYRYGSGAYRKYFLYNTESSMWSNWVHQHAEDRTRREPKTPAGVIASLVERVRSEEKIRAVGSGHSHSNAPEPPENYIDLNPGEPESDEPEGMDSVLDNEFDGNHWLKSDQTLASIQRDRDTSGHETQPLDRDHLKRLQAGVTIRRLNRFILHENGYALKNMGSFDGQTIAGAINTSTHGTGVRLSSIADAVESVELATVVESASGRPIVRMFRIEPSDGITDREAFEADTEHHRSELIQDDDVFYSAVVGYGCMGVACAYTLHVRDRYWLREDVELMSWETLSSALADDHGDVTDESVEAFLRQTDGDGRECRHTQMLVNIAADQVPDIGRYIQDHEDHGLGVHEAGRGADDEVGNPLCLIKRHYEISGDEIPEEPENWPPFGRIDDRWPPERPPQTARYLGKDLDIHLLDDNLKKAKILHKNLFHPSYRTEPFIGNYDESAWYVALRRLRDGAGPNMPDNPEHYHPEPPEPPAMTTEVGVELGNIVDAVEEAREKIVDIEMTENVPGKAIDSQGKNVFFPAPMGLRFTAASDHYLSPEHDRKTAMLEVPLPIYGNLSANVVQGIPSLTFDENREHVVGPSLSKLHDHLVTDGNHAFDARPHMGKHNTVDEDWLERNYDEYDTWLDVYRRFNRFGTFNNKFTDQLGISMTEYDSSDRIGTGEDE